MSLMCFYFIVYDIMTQEMRYIIIFFVDILTLSQDLGLNIQDMIHC